MLQNKLKTKGFTLLEILVALFIFTIVAVIMAQVLHTVFVSQSSTEKRAGRLADLEIATLLFSHDLEQTINRPVMNAKNIPEAAFIGTTNSITFTHGGLANPTGEIQRSTLQRCHYFLNKHEFMRQIWQTLDQTQTSQPLQRKLLDDVSDLRFEYLDSKGYFHNTWPPSESTKSAPLPRGVRMTLTLMHWGKFSELYLITGQTGDPTNA